MIELYLIPILIVGLYVAEYFIERRREKRIQEFERLYIEPELIPHLEFLEMLKSDMARMTGVKKKLMGNDAG